MDIDQGQVNLIIMIVIAVSVNVWLAKRKGRGVVKWILAGVFLSFISTIILFFLSEPQELKVERELRIYCTWCGEKDDLELSKEGPGSFSHTYTNKDGSPDKRKKDNPYLAQFEQFFTCNQCTAESRVRRSWSRTPVADDKISYVELRSNGKGQRSAKDISI